LRDNSKSDNFVGWQVVARQLGKWQVVARQVVGRQVVGRQVVGRPIYIPMRILKLLQSQLFFIPI
jgi:hypothetical protein